MLQFKGVEMTQILISVNQRSHLCRKGVKEVKQHLYPRRILLRSSGRAISREERERPWQRNTPSAIWVPQKSEFPSEALPVGLLCLVFLSDVNFLLCINSYVWRCMRLWPLHRLCKVLEQDISHIPIWVHTHKHTHTESVQRQEAEKGLSLRKRVGVCESERHKIPRKKERRGSGRHAKHKERKRRDNRCLLHPKTFRHLMPSHSSSWSVSYRAHSDFCSPQ